MNERIKELAEHAGGEFYEGFAGSTNFVKFAEDDFEKFAELIVRECVEVVGDCSDQFATRSQITEEIKQNFGVE